MSTPYRQAPPRVARRLVRVTDLLPETQARLATVCQDRWVAGLLGSDRPLRRPHWPLLAGGLAVLSGVGLCAGLASWPQALAQPRWLAALWALWLAAIASFGAYWRRRTGSGTVVEPGVYLFVRDLLDVRSGEVAVYSTEGLRSLHRRRFPGAVLLTFATGEVFAIEAVSAGPTELAQLMTQQRARLEQAEAAGAHAAIDELDPLQAERARWEQQGPGAFRFPGPWPGRLAAVLLAGALALVTALGLDFQAIHRADLAHDVATLARHARPPALLSGRADQAWQEQALASNDERQLLRYSLVGQHPERARAALAALNGGRCQSEACWRELAATCHEDGRTDRALLERSLPYRLRLGSGSGQPPSGNGGRPSAWLDSLGPLLGGCPGALSAGELARLDLRNASLSPELPGLLWTYVNAPEYWWLNAASLGDTGSLRAEAREALRALYAAEQARLEQRPQRPWVQAQLTLLAHLAAHDAEVSFSVQHGQGLSHPEPGLVPPAVTRRLSQRIERASPLLRLREARDPDRADPPSLRLGLSWMRTREGNHPAVISYDWSVKLPGLNLPQSFSDNFWPDLRRSDPQGFQRGPNSIDQQALDAFLDAFFE